MQSILRSNDDVKVITEFWPQGLRDAGYAAEDYLRLLADCGFQFFEISERDETVEACDEAALLSGYTESGGHTNLLCVKGGRTDFRQPGR